MAALLYPRHGTAASTTKTTSLVLRVGLGLAVALLGATLFGLPLVAVGMPVQQTDTRRRRRLLLNGENKGVHNGSSSGDDGDGAAVLPTSGRNEPLFSYQSRCNDELYELYLDGGVHFSLYAAPTRREAWDSCEPLKLHADSANDDGKAKEILVMDGSTKENTRDVSYGSLPLGTFVLYDILASFDAIEVDAPGTREYNIVTNNCAVLILGMMRTLGIQLTPKDRKAVVDGLVAADKEANDKLASYIRESGEIGRSLGLSEDATNEELLERLTLRQIELALDSDPESKLQTPNGDRDLIIQGDPVTSQVFPFIVEPSNELDGDPCSAVLVAPDVILTTALICEYTFRTSSRVLVGSYRRGSTQGPAQWRNITSDIHIHPGLKYVNKTYFVKDFAMMKIDAVTLPNLVPIVLNPVPVTPTNGKNLTVLGYGRWKRGTQNSVSNVLRRASVRVLNTQACKRSLSYNPADAFCASSPDQYPCYGDESGAVIDGEGTLVGLVRSDEETPCADGKPNLYNSIAGSIGWIRQTICKLSDFKSNYSFCPELICPPDQILLGDPQTIPSGAAFLPQVNTSLLNLPLTNVTQSPASGLLKEQGTSTVVTVTGMTASNETLSCKWRITVQDIWLGFFVEFRAKAGNTTSSKTYDLVYPVMGTFYGVLAFLDDLAPFMTSKSSVQVTFKRFDPLNATDKSVVHSIRVRGTKDLFINEYIDSPVSFPDYKYRYQVDFKTRGLKRGAKIQYLLYSQEKKLV